MIKTIISKSGDKMTQKEHEQFAMEVEKAKSMECEVSSVGIGKIIECDMNNTEVDNIEYDEDCMPLSEEIYNNLWKYIRKNGKPSIKEMQIKYIRDVKEELIRRGVPEDAVERVINKTGFYAAIEEYPEEQMHYSVTDAVDEILLVAACAEESVPTLHRAINVRPMEQYKLLIRFDIGESRIYDCNPLLQYDMYQKLRDEEVFKKVYVDKMGIVCWDESTNINPYDLYNDSVCHYVKGVSNE